MSEVSIIPEFIRGGDVILATKRIESVEHADRDGAVLLRTIAGAQYEIDVKNPDASINSIADMLNAWVIE